MFSGIAHFSQLYCNTNTRASLLYCNTKKQNLFILVFHTMLSCSLSLNFKLFHFWHRHEPRALKVTCSVCGPFAEPALNDVMWPYLILLQKFVLLPQTCQCLRIVQYQRLTKMWPLHSMPCTQLQPYTPVRTGMLSSAWWPLQGLVQWWWGGDWFVWTSS
jgi:hypothetical protein